MKKINIYILGLLLIFIGSSCEDEDFTGKASLEPVSGVSASVDVSDIQSSYLESNEDTMRIVLTLSELQSGADAVFHATQIGGDATLDEDYVFIDEDGLGLAKKVIPAKSDLQTLTWSIVVLDDCVGESTETVELQFGDERTANVSIDPVTSSFSINNYRADIPVITMEWGTDLNGEDIEFGNGDNGWAVADIDMDLLLLDDQGQLVANYSAATGSNPEELPFAAGDGSELPDGTYYLLADMWSSFDVGADADPVEFPLFFNFTRCGGSLNTNATFNGFDSNGYLAEGTYQSGAIAYMVTKQGQNITVNDGTVDIASGKIEEIRSQISK
mgnify:CR=1 FL=1|jgi:hypothetical protein